jgi:2-(1,2-epoxy-1,2-dihydrophenyl)acetyl-CoA isomerase
VSAIAEVEGIETRIDGGVAVLTLARPEKLNALTDAMMDALPGVVTALAKGDAVRCLVIRGAGRAFCAGGDLSTVAWGATAPHEDVVARMDLRHGLTRAIVTAPVPVIASVRGVAAGAGMSLALACDLRIVAESARFVTAFANVAFCGDYGGAWTLQRLIGPARARELYFTGGTLDAPEAARLGVAGRVVPDERLDAETMDLARKIAEGPPLAIRRMKENMNLAMRADLDALLHAEAEGTALLMKTRDSAEALQAFAEKRRPRFEGR